MTRLVSLSNAVIVSSPLQKAAYWHLLEVCLHEEAFSPYVIVLLEGISARLGLSHSSAIFQAYASQVAILIHKGGHDFLRLSPKLLGFRNIKECAESTFLSFMSASLISSDAWDLTQKSILDVPFFLNYCTAIQKDPREALKECFPRLIALHLLTRAGTWNEDQMSPETLKWIMDCAKDCNPEGDPQVFLSSCSDQIVAAMLCLCGDIDYSQNGDIISQIQRASVRSFQGDGVRFTANIYKACWKSKLNLCGGFQSAKSIPRQYRFRYAFCQLSISSYIHCLASIVLVKRDRA